MNILHYSLGLPPYRTGGLTKYSFDLMKEQVKNGERVYLLFPGKMSFVNNKTKIRYYKNESGIITYEIVNPLPVPLLSGTFEPQKFMKTCDKEIFKSFLIHNNIQIVHIHTFMGLYKEFLEACNDLSIKKVYTTHDYFGICTKVNFIDYKGELCNERDLNKCVICNCNGYSMKTIKILQCSIYRFLKNQGIISKVKKVLCKVKSKKDTNVLYDEVKASKNCINIKQYKKLIDYYKSMYLYIDKFLFNSTVAKSIYQKYLNIDGCIVPITHSEIKDNRIKRYYTSKKLKLTYLGPNKKYKGFYLLTDIMKSLKETGYKDIILNAYGDNNVPISLPSNMKINGSYSYDELSSIFDCTDLLIVPSICNETFGFITLEALSYGVPVLLTDKVGSKDLVNNGIDKGMITSAIKNELSNEIIKIFNNRDILKTLNINILNDKFYGSIINHYYSINSTYIRILNKV